MPRYLIERELPGAGALSPSDLHAIAAKSNGVIADMGGRVQWMRSFVTDDAITCEYFAEDADAVREHATRGGFPANLVRQVTTTLDPTTGE